MGCPCALHLEAAEETRAHRAFDAVLAEVDRLDRKYSHYRDDSLIAQIANTREGLALDSETSDLIDFAAELHRQSEGLFDITAGTLTRLWDAQRGKPPTNAEVTEALRHTGWAHVEWRRPHLRLTIDRMRIDLGGLVKEYAADRCAELCRAEGVHSGVVDLGGDLALIGPHEDGSPWIVGIKAPRSAGRAAASIELLHGGLATSGDYERALIIDGKRYSHIVDPLGGYPVQGFASVSVAADSCLVAGAAATLAMLLGAQRGGSYLRELGLPHLCIDLELRVSGDIAAAD